MSEESAFTMVSCEEVWDELGQAEEHLNAATPALFGAITRATLKLESVIGQDSFEPRECADVFHIDPAEVGNPRGGLFNLMLTNGSLRSDVPVVVSHAENPDGPYTAFTPVRIDDRLGVVYIKQVGMEGRYVQVQYASGYMDGDAIPEQLRQALFLLVPQLLLSSASTQLDPKAAAVQNKRVATLSSFSEDMVYSFLRRVGACFKPLYGSWAPYEPTPAD